MKTFVSVNFITTKQISMGLLSLLFSNFIICICKD